MLTYLYICAIADDEQIAHLCDEHQMLDFSLSEADYRDSRHDPSWRMLNPQLVRACERMERALCDGLAYRMAHAGFPWFVDTNPMPTGCDRCGTEDTGRFPTGCTLTCADCIETMREHLEQAELVESNTGVVYDDIPF